MPLTAYRGRFYKPSLRTRLGKKKKLVLALAIVALTLLMGGGVAFWQIFSEPGWGTYQNDALGIKLDWPDNFQTTILTDVDKESGIVFKIEHARPEAQVFLRYEADLGPIRFTGKTILDYLVETIDRTYPQRFPDYQKEDYRQFVLAGQNAGEFTFTYSGKDKGGGEIRIKQRYIIAVKDEKNIAFFLSCQALENEFFKSEKDFDKIISSLEFVD